MYTLHGHLGGVLLLATTGLGDTLVSVGIDRVAKVAMGRQTSCWFDLFRSGVATSWQAPCSNPLVGSGAWPHFGMSLQ